MKKDFCKVVKMVQTNTGKTFKLGDNVIIIYIIDGKFYLNNGTISDITMKDGYSQPDEIDLFIKDTNDEFRHENIPVSTILYISYFDDEFVRELKNSLNGDNKKFESDAEMARYRLGLDLWK